MWGYTETDRLPTSRRGQRISCPGGWVGMEECFGALPQWPFLCLDVFWITGLVDLGFRRGIYTSTLYTSLYGQLTIVRVKTHERSAQAGAPPVIPLTIGFANGAQQTSEPLFSLRLLSYWRLKRRYRRSLQWKKHSFTSYLLNGTRFYDISGLRW